MSYDLMVFDPSAPPPDRAGYMAWYHEQTQWSEVHDYDDPKVSTPELRAWFLEMIQAFPAMNGPYASDDVDDPRVTDYCVGKSVIYAAFAWSESVVALETMFELARKHKVGFFDVSSDNGQVWMPDGAGGWDCVPGGDDP
jgi:hypothetical protein